MCSQDQRSSLLALVCHSVLRPVMKMYSNHRRYHRPRSMKFFVCIKEYGGAVLMPRDVMVKYQVIWRYELSSVTFDTVEELIAF